MSLKVHNYNYLEKHYTFCRVILSKTPDKYIIQYDFKDWDFIRVEICVHVHAISSLFSLLCIWFLSRARGGPLACRQLAMHAHTRAGGPFRLQPPAGRGVNARQLPLRGKSPYLWCRVTAQGRLLTWEGKWRELLGDGVTHGRDERRTPSGRPARA